MKKIERYANNQIDENTFQVDLNQFILRQKQLTLEINNSEETISHSLDFCLDNMDIDYALINKLVKEVAVKNTGKREYDFHIKYTFKNQILKD